MSDADGDAERRLFAVDAALGSKAKSSLSDEEWVFLDVWSLESEINNGGFSQYFLNSSGRNAGRIASSLKRIGADHCAKIVAQALELVDHPTLDWGDDGARQEAVRRLGVLGEEKLETLDEQFLAYPDDLSALLDRFVTAHATTFG